MSEASAPKDVMLDSTVQGACAIVVPIASEHVMRLLLMRRMAIAQNVKLDLLAANAT